MMITLAPMAPSASPDTARAGRSADGDVRADKPVAVNPQSAPNLEATAMATSTALASDSVTVEPAPTPVLAMSTAPALKCALSSVAGRRLRPE